MPQAQPTLFYVVDWLPPDFGAVGQYAVYFATELAEKGRRVCLIGLTSGMERSEQLSFGGTGNLEIRRLAAKGYDKSRKLARLGWTAHANARLITEVLRHPESRKAEVLFTGSPPFMLFFARFAKTLRGARLIYRITDFHPEVLIAELGRQPLALKALQQVTWWLRRRVDAFEVLGEDQRRLLMAGGIAAERIRLKRDLPPVAVTGAEAPLQRPDSLRGFKVLLYSGNYGVAHDVETVVDGLIRHHREGSGQYALWLSATGAKVEAVSRRLREAGVPFAHTDPVPLEKLPILLAAADVHLVTLRPQFSGIVLPSKIYACIASKRPILFVGPEGSDVHLLSSQSGLPYRRVEPGDAIGFADVLQEWAMTSYPMEPSRVRSAALASRN